MVPLGAQDRAGTIADMTDMMIEPGEWNAQERGEFQVLGPEFAAVKLNRLRKRALQTTPEQRRRSWGLGVRWCRRCNSLRSTDGTFLSEEINQLGGGAVSSD